MAYLFLKFVIIRLSIMNKRVVIMIYVEITKEEYERLQEELNAQKEETTTE